LHQIDQNNLKDLHVPGEEILGRGVFGICKKKSYRGQTVAVKFFNKKMSAEAVKKEAVMINIFDHNGMYVTSVTVFILKQFLVNFCPQSEKIDTLRYSICGIVTSILYSTGICLETCNGDIDKFSPTNDRGDRPLVPEMFLSSQKIFPQEIKQL
jgi:hypothetical protein